VPSVPLTREGDLDPAFVALCKSVTAKRARTVIDHILEHGIVTNEELRELYGYEQPPRAARDVREQGIPLNTHKVPSKATGRLIGAYTLGDPSKVKHGRIGGRRALPKHFKEELVARYGARDCVTGEALDPFYLQVDHRIPYEIAGDSVGAPDPADFMLLDASSQRTKSTACEQCPNWSGAGDPETCRGCYWAFPEDYTHVATEPVRRVVLVWRGDDVAEYDRLAREAAAKGVTVAERIKAALTPKPEAVVRRAGGLGAMIMALIGRFTG